MHKTEIWFEIVEQIEHRHTCNRGAKAQRIVNRQQNSGKTKNQNFKGLIQFKSCRYTAITLILVRICFNLEILQKEYTV